MQTLTREQMDHQGAHAAPGGRRSRFLDRSAWWPFGRHLGEMIVAMMAGMALLGIAIAALGTPPGYSDPLVHYTWMGVAMSAPMVAWMRRMGHTWADGLEMTASMLVPMYLFVVPVALGLTVPGLTAHSLPLLSHLAMIVGMAGLMLYRWDRYVGGGAHCH